jgi:fumarate hydratase class II
MGAMEVPADAYYGAQTRRAELNFAISPLRLPRPMIRALGLIKKSAAAVNRDLGLLPPEVAGRILEAAGAVAEGRHDDQFVVDIFQTGSGTSSNMNANEVIAGIANEAATGVRGGRKPVHPNDHVNLGQSSNDVFPTAIHVAAVDRIRNRLAPALEGLHARLDAKAKEFDPIVKIGRTHLQDAVPIRLGQEFSGFAGQVAHGIARVDRAAEALAELPIGGTAVGTGINTHAEFPGRMTAQLGRETGLGFRPAANPFEALANRDAAVEASGAIKTVAISLSNIANNLRWLASGPRCGIGEIRIPELQPGSSIMPAKVNPVIPEAVMMVAARVVGNDATIAWADALGSNFQLNVMMPVLGHALLESIELLAGAAEHLAEKCVDAADYFARIGVTFDDPEAVTRIEADPRAPESVERSLAMCTALAPALGYDVAAAIAKAAHKTRANVRDVALDLAGRPAAEAAERLHLPEPPRRDIPAAADLERLLDPQSQTVRGTGVGRAAGG